jgi:phasin family protein
MFTVDQIVAAQKANVEIFAGLTGRAFESVERLVELNLAASKAALADATENTKAALAAKDAQEFFSLQAGLVQPAAEKAAAYGRHVYDIAQGTAGDFAKAFEAQATAAQKKFAEAIDTAAANAPAGTESAVALVKSAYAAQANFDSVAATVTAAPVKASKKR